MSLFDLGPEPKWETCGCGQQSARVPCWTCAEAARARVATAERDAVLLTSIPARFRWARLDAPELATRCQLNGTTPQLAGALVLRAAGAVFAGPAGSGKTSLAVACLHARGTGLFVPALRLGTARQQSRLGGGEAPAVDDAVRAPLLLLDDVGQEAKTATNAVKDVVFARHDADRPTWITTGLSAKQLAEVYGDGFVRRIFEGAYAVRMGAK